MATNQAIKDMLWELEDDIAMLASTYHDEAESDNKELQKWMNPFSAVNFDHYLTRGTLNNNFWCELCGIIQRLREISDTI